MDSAATRLLTTLVVFRNTVRAELVRSVHVYRLSNGEHCEVEREFWFSQTELYVEMGTTPVLKSKNFRVSEVSEGYKNGVWRCIFAFHADKESQFSSIPSLLLVRRNHKLRTIPNLFDDLHMINKLECESDVLDQDLNCRPYPDGMFECDNKLADESLPGTVQMKKRAPPDQVARMDLVKYFDIPIAEAARLNVGLTVLKRKCRQFGIPRWPHRKIKSLDGLINDLQEEADYQELEENKDAAMAMTERQKILECERENMERKPDIDIEKDTKKFRQGMLKRKHKARVLQKQGSAVNST